MIKLYRADQMHPSSSVVALSSLQKTVRKSREVTDRLIQQLIDTGYIPEEKKLELLSVFDKETELQRLESENYLLHKAREISGEVTDIEKNKCITYEKTLEEKLKEVKMDYIFGKITLEEAIKIINGENSLCQPQSNE